MGKLREMTVELKLSSPVLRGKDRKYEKSFAFCHAGSRYVGGSDICPSTGKDLRNSSGLREPLQRHDYVCQAMLLL